MYKIQSFLSALCIKKTYQPELRGEGSYYFCLQEGPDIVTKDNQTFDFSVSKNPLAMYKTEIEKYCKIFNNNNCRQVDPRSVIEMSRYCKPDKLFKSLSFWTIYMESQKLEKYSSYSKENNLNRFSLFIPCNILCVAITIAEVLFWSEICFKQRRHHTVNYVYAGTVQQIYQIQKRSTTFQMSRTALSPGPNSAEQKNPMLYIESQNKLVHQTRVYYKLLQLCDIVNNITLNYPLHTIL
ncbi:Hypothetical_protein [Hexamita inflata]|uniref:Hypothetical_protein n=1 Tax=Hexamita inflata TaxID=28002 RepID=A0AA86QTX1_9EUKA|nr:Hypothetical protein HINF_LOCUS53629 [Hexamita inflata]